MIGWSASVTVQVALLVTMADSYQEAYEQATEEGKPLLVLVGAEWCPGCRTMKRENIPALEKNGGLEQVVFTTVDSDEKPTLTGRLLRGNAIPQLVMLTQTATGWRRARLTGVHAPKEIRQFIDREIAAARQARKDAEADAAPAASEATGAAPAEQR